MAHLDFHPSPSRPTEKALERFAEEADELCDLIGVGIEILASSVNGVHSATNVIHIQGNLWCLAAWHKDSWAFLFFVELRRGIIMLNGYLKKGLAKMPKLSRAQMRKAKYLATEMQHAW
jgi:hypothetical protein